MIKKYILSFFILLFTFDFGANIQVVEDFSDAPDAIQSQQNIVKVAPIKEKPVASVIDKVESHPVILKRVDKKRVSKEKPKYKIKKELTKKSKKNIKIEKNYHKHSGAKLVIIMDDISHRFQLNLLKQLHLKITPSIFPPNKMNMHSNRLSFGLKHFMVHLPLESRSRAMNKMHKTILTSNSNKQIIARVKEIRRLFPTAKYLNNHTGSKFSENYKKSKVLYKALIDNGFKFVDSKTTQKSKFKKIAREFGKRYVDNNIFLDDKVATADTLKQIRKGIALAKRKGFAIVICHPHPTTFKALREAKKYLNSVNLVYIDEVY